MLLLLFRGTPGEAPVVTYETGWADVGFVFAIGYADVGLVAAAGYADVGLVTTVGGPDGEGGVN